VLHPEFRALATEVGNTLIYAASKTRGQPSNAIYLMGGVARYPRVASSIEGLVSMPVEVLNPFTVSPRAPMRPCSGLDPMPASHGGRSRGCAGARHMVDLSRRITACAPPARMAAWLGHAAPASSC